MFKKIAAIFFAVTGTVLFAASAIAEPKLNPANNHWYNIVEVADASANFWENANSMASMQGGSLATINDETEQAWIYNNLISGTFRNYWIGLNDALVENTLVWESGESSTYANWSSAWDNTPTRDYGYIRQSDGKWDLAAGNAYKLGIAEWPATTTAPEPVSSSLLISGGLLMLIRGYRKINSDCHKR